MELIANELSVHHQFADTHTFYQSVRRIQEIRNLAKQFGLDISCNRSILSMEPIRGMGLSRVIAGLMPDERRSMMSWLTTNGPFLDDDRRQNSDDYLEWRSLQLRP